MAGVDTIYNIALKISAGGLGQAQNGFDDLAKSVFKGSLAANMVTKAFGLVVDKTQELIARSFRVNEVYDDIEDRLTGLIMTTAKFAQSEDPIARFEKSSQASALMLERFTKTAIKTAIPVEQIAELSARIEPIWAATGASMEQIVKATDAAASVAGVFGISTEKVLSSAQKILLTGKAGRNDEIGRLLISKAHLKSTDSLLVRTQKLGKAMEEIGAPVDKLAKGTKEATQRWQTLTDSVLRRATKPIYDKIGEVIQRIVDWTVKHEDAINRVVFFTHDLFDAVSGVASGFLKGAEAIGSWWINLDVVQNSLGAIVDLGKGFFRVIELVGHAWKVVGEGIDVLADPSRGLGKLNTLVDGLYVKLLKVVQAFADLMGKVAKIVLPETVIDMLPAPMKNFAKDVQDTYKYFDQYVADREKKVANQEAKLGMEPTTDLGKDLARRREGTNDLLKKLFGEKRPLIAQNIDKIEIRQDFRDQDPDRIMVEFTKELERLGETAYQSTVGGAATAFGPGSV